MSEAQRAESGESIRLRAEHGAGGSSGEYAPPIADVERPDIDIDRPEIPLPPDCKPPPPDSDEGSREELELALERARLVADDCASILKPAIQAMHDQAWVSQRADEFSLELEDHARKATEAGEETVQLIEDRLNRQDGSDNPVVLPDEVNFDLPDETGFVPHEPRILPAEHGTEGDV
ncbi:hypothetical protein EF847_05430 [Actinobacteria bacterium YIM 96077]|uniref:Uncharacterized protein n=1 Tax=Phytoactinopolyspora halophila TaxID=1981511 RepID=A0A329R1P5_9ACTN|nr:hypothetical protein [Phytoactinopolyspora halophila]AYY12232.1 hypothetical protein EF847_05430 [Actinobacteria bacterium YIM 96077]RAW18535.1 hypothetical protein DPM12_00085 [Phytoactinopolyspora halophila]